MFIYNKLFYCADRLAEKSRNFNGDEYISGIGSVCFCFIINLISIVLLLQGVGFYPEANFFPEEYTIFIALILDIPIFLYYRCGKRYIQIVDYYKKRKIKTNNWLYVLSWYFISAFIAFIAGTFYNRVWIFESIPPIDLF